MQRKEPIMRNAVYLSALFMLILAACGPASLAPGLGPPLDPLVGWVLLVALVCGGLWVVKIAVRSPTGQAVERTISEASQSIRNQLGQSAGRVNKERHESPPMSRAEELLKERYARGDIDRKQYLEMLDDLKRQ
jgi:hypothetical protein